MNTPTHPIAGSSPPVTEASDVVEEAWRRLRFAAAQRERGVEREAMHAKRSGGDYDAARRSVMSYATVSVRLEDLLAALDPQVSHEFREEIKDGRPESAIVDAPRAAITKSEGL